MLRFSSAEWNNAVEEKATAIANYLSQEPGKWRPTLEIAKALAGKDGVKKDVNAALYSLEEQGRIVREAIGGKTKWHWRLKPDEDTTDAKFLEQAALTDLTLQKQKGMSADLTEGPVQTQTGDLGLTAPANQRFVTSSTGTRNSALPIQEVRAALNDPAALRRLADSLKPRYRAHVQRIINATLQTVCEKAGQCLGDVLPAPCKVDMIGSRAYDIDIIGSDVDYVVNAGEQYFYDAGWHNLAAELNRTEHLEGRVAAGKLHISINLPKVRSCSSFHCMGNLNTTRCHFPT